MPGGPQSYSHEERLQRAGDIYCQIERHFAGRILAAGIYGSLARGSDGPYSDIEMHIVLADQPQESSYEWSTGPWKAEVDLYSEPGIREKAAELDEFWPVTQGAYASVLALYDPRGLFPQLREAVFAHTDEALRELLAEVIVGDIYECVGKVRNAMALQRTGALTEFALEAVRFGACLIGLSQLTLYTSGAAVFAESLALPDRPGGYDGLCRRAMAGDFVDFQGVAADVDAFWSGLEAWASAHELRLETDLATLLRAEA
jgi:kanamycin nucleotidyltransferase